MPPWNVNIDVERPLDIVPMQRIAIKNIAIHKMKDSLRFTEVFFTVHGGPKTGGWDPVTLAVLSHTCPQHHTDVFLEPGFRYAITVEGPNAISLNGIFYDGDIVEKASRPMNEADSHTTANQVFNGDNYRNKRMAESALEGNLEFKRMRLDSDDSSDYKEWKGKGRYQDRRDGPSFRKGR